MSKKSVRIDIDPPSESSEHPEARGLFIIACSLLLFLSLFSFQDGTISANILGKVGYYLAFSLVYVFGFTSYMLTGYVLWIGLQYLLKGYVNNLLGRTLVFFVFTFSTSILLNVVAESKVFSELSLNAKVYSESFIVKGVFSHKYVRNNYGGVPFYYLYRDLPKFNFQHLFGDIGVCFLFGTVAFISFILFTGLRLVSLAQSLLRGWLRLVDFLVHLYQDTPEKNEPMAEEQPALSITLSGPPLPKTKKPTLEELKLRPRERKPRLILDSPSMDEDDEEEIKQKPKSKDLVDAPPLEIKQFSVSPVAKEKLFDSKKIAYKASTIGISLKDYSLPPLSLLSNAKKIDQPSLEKDLKKQAETLEESLRSFGIEAKVGEINCGPTITSFALHPAIGVKVQKIKALENDIALNLKAKSIRIIAPIPGKAAVGVEIPSPCPQEVGFKEMLYQYQQSNKNYRIPILLGKTVTGENVVCDLTKMPHCIIAGATGSGKSVCINTIIMSILMTSHPEETKLILIDPKKVELTPFTRLPHMIAPVITEAHGAYAALSWLVKEMQRRYDILKHLGLRNITAFNNRKINLEVESTLEGEIPQKMSTIVAIIDEFADLMMTSSADLETPIARIAQMARAVGIHLILATQRPSREVITGLIKANFPSRIAFKVASRINSQIILDENGAESLLGNGDLLFLPPGTSQLMRAQGAYIRDEDINQIVEYVEKQAPPNYLISSFDEMPSGETNIDDDDDAPKDSLYHKARELVLSTRTASTTFIQRKLKVGYARAASLMDELEENGVIGPADGSKPRKILSQGDIFSDDG